jgi:hypothetical protein
VYDDLISLLEDGKRFQDEDRRPNLPSSQESTKRILIFLSCTVTPTSSSSSLLSSSVLSPSLPSSTSLLRTLLMSSSIVSPYNSEILSITKTLSKTTPIGTSQIKAMEIDKITASLCGGGHDGYPKLMLSSPTSSEVDEINLIISNHCDSSSSLEYGSPWTSLLSHCAAMQ